MVSRLFQGHLSVSEFMNTRLEFELSLPIFHSEPQSITPSAYLRGTEKEKRESKGRLLKSKEKHKHCEWVRKEESKAEESRTEESWVEESRKEESWAEESR